MPGYTLSCAKSSAACYRTMLRKGIGRLTALALVPLAAISALDEVTLTTTVDTAVEPQAATAFVNASAAVNGTMTLTRNTTVGALTVRLTTGGSATVGTDYTMQLVSAPAGASIGALSGLTYDVTMPAGVASLTVALVPVDDTFVEGLETVTVQLTNTLAYVISTPNSASIAITDADLRLRTINVDTLAAEFINGEDTASLTYQFYDANTGNAVGAPAATTGLPTPEIHVTREEPQTLTITDGLVSDIIDLTEPIHRTAPGVAKRLTYSIWNLGSETLNLTLPITSSNLGNCTVAINQPSQVSVPSDGHLEFIVDVTPTAVGAWTFDVSVANDDANESPYNWTVTGTAAAAAAELNVVRDGVSVADGGADALVTAVSPSSAGVEKALLYTITNNGSLDANITASATVGALVNCTAAIAPVDQPSTPILRDGRTSMTVRITPTAAGNWSCAVSFPNNDGNENPYDWTISGTATAATPEMEVRYLNGTTTGGAPIAGTSITSGSTQTIVGTAVGWIRSVSYTIRNDGSSNLNLGSVTLIGTGANVSIINNPATVVLPGSSTNLVFTVTPTSANWLVAVSIPTDDTSENPYAWTVSGAALTSVAMPIAIQVVQTSVEDAGVIRPATINNDYNLTWPTGWVSSGNIGTMSQVFNGNMVPGTSQWNVLLTAIQDTAREASETARFRVLQNRAFIVDTPANTDLVIADDDVMISIERVSDATEPLINGGTGHNGIHRIKLTAAFPADVAGTINIPYQISGAAVFGTDYSISGATSTGGQATVDTDGVTVLVDLASQPVFDGVTEGSESVTLTLLTSPDYRLPTTGGSSGNASATVNILDNQGLVVPSVITHGREGDASTRTDIVFRLTLTDATGATVTAAVNQIVSYTLSSPAGTATSATDFQPATGTATITAGSSSVDVTVTVIDDQVVEATETVVLQVTPAAWGGYGVSGTGQAIANLVDDEPVVSVVASVSATAEPASSTGTPTPSVFTISYPGVPSGTALNRAVTVSYTLGGSATSGTDYTTLTGTAVIPAGSTSVTVQVAPIYDNLIEGPEPVVLTVTDVGGAGAGAYDVAAASSATITITDDQTAVGTVTVAGTDLGATERDGATVDDGMVTFTLARTGTDAATVVYTVGGTAMAGADYQTVSTSLNFGVFSNGAAASGATSVTLTSTSGTQVLVAGTVLEVGIGGTQLTVTTTTTIGSTATSVPVSALGAAIAAGTTYVRSIPVSVVVTDDQTVETAETVVFTVTSGAHYLAGATATQTVTIADDEPVVSVVASVSTTAEPTSATGTSTPGVFTISYPGVPSGTALNRAVTVSYTLGGSATSGTDYTTLTGTAVIPAGSTSVTVQVAPLYDSVVPLEGNESVAMNLIDNGGAFAGTYDVATTSATVTIADDTTSIGTVSLTTTDGTAQETDGGTLNTATVLATLARNAGQTGAVNATYNVSTSGNLADTEGVDFTTLSRTLNFTSVSVAANAAIGATSISLTSANGTIVLSAGTVLEAGIGGTQVTMSTTVSIGSVASSVTVPALTAAATAGDVWYIRSIPIVISPIDDRTVEATGTVTIDLVSGAHHQVSATAVTASVIILDDEPTVAILAASDTGGDARATEPLTATASVTDRGLFIISYPGLPAGTALNRDVTVTLTVASGAGFATPGTDYSSLPATVVIPAGSRSVTVPVVPLYDNLAYDPGELVRVSISSPASDFSAGTSVATVTIDDRTPSIAMTAARNSVEPLTLRDASLADTTPDGTASGDNTLFFNEGITSTLAPLAVGGRLRIDSETVTISQLLSSNGKIVGVQTVAATTAAHAFNATVTSISGGTSLAVTTSPSTDQLPVYLALAGTATLDTDYTVPARAIELPPLSLAQSAEITTGAAMAVGDTILDVTMAATASSPFAAGTQVLVDQELFTVTSITPVSSTRQQLNLGAAATAAHAAGATVHVARHPATLATLLSSSATTVDITDVPQLSSRLAVNDYLQIDAELMRVTAIGAPVSGMTPSVTVTRAAFGTVAAAHAAGAAWQRSSAVLSVAATAGAASLTIEPIATGSNPFLVGRLVRIDGEWMRINSIVVTGINVTGITVSRAVGGTTAAIHPLGSPLFLGSVYTMDLAAGSTGATVDITPLDDTVIDASETVQVGILADPNGVYLLDAAGVLQTATIIDEEPESVSIARDRDLSESGDVGRATVTLSSLASGSVTVPIDCSTWPAGSTSVKVDAIVPGLTAGDQLLIGSGNDYLYTVTGVAGTTIGITPSLQDGRMSGATVLARGRTSAAMSLVANPGRADLTGDYSVAVAAGSSGAALGAFSGGQATLTISAGTQTASLDFTAVDDTADEGNEAAVVTLVGRTGSTSLAQLVLVDNDGPVSFTLEKITDAAEPSSSGSFRVKASKTLTAAATVTLAVSGTAVRDTDGTFATGEDYRLSGAGLSGNVVTFAIGDTEQVVNLVVNDDAIAELVETVQVDISGAIGLGTSLLMSIGDDDPASITFNAVSSTIAEDGVSGTILVRRSGGLTGAAQVTYTVTGGTATNGTDYVLSSGTLVWAIGDSAAKTIPFTVVDDGVAESDETFSVGLSVPTGAILGAITAHTVTITDTGAPATTGGGAGGGGGDATSSGGGCGAGGGAAIIVYAALALVAVRRRGRPS